MTADELKKSILQLAIQGKLVPAVPAAGTQKLNTSGPFPVPANWKWKKLGEIAEINGGFAFQSQNFSTTGTRVIRISDFDENGFRNTNIVRHKFDESLKPFLLEEKNILIAMTGGSVGKSYFVKNLPETMVVNQRVATVKVSSQCVPEYISAVISSEMIQKIVQESKNSTNDNISMVTIKNFPVPVPAIEEQEKIVAKLEEILPLVEIYGNAEKQLSQLQKSLPNDLKKSILQAAIQGKLVPAAGTQKLNDSGPFPVPANWKWKKLGEICELQDGEKLAGTPFPNLDAKFLRGKSEAKILQSGKFVPAGTRMILVDGENSGEVFTTPIDGYLGSTFKVLVISPTINVDYILHFLAYYQKTFRESKTGSAIPHLNKKLFRDLPVPVPPVEEQARIVAKLEEILPLVEIYGNAEKQLSQLQKSLPSDLKKSILQAAIQGKLVPAAGTPKTNNSGPFPVPANWTWKKLGEICRKEIKRGKSPKYSPTGKTLVFAQKCNTKIGEIDLSLAQRLDDSVLAKYPEAEFMQDGDIVINSTGTGTLGRVGIFKNSDNPNNEKIVPDSHVTVIRLNKNFVPDFVYYYLKFYQKDFEEMGEGSTNQKELKPKSISNYFVPVPPVEEQEKIVAKLDEIFALFSAFPREL